ncbi:MAG: helix-turn-helix domain-containing protein [Rhodospirillales bacterium]|nr:helix-turn-helix domain-containing protein [Rhodospirillales bacterium]MDE2576639.1 helix-turn-helix domain-containing protein [Rhodospirillales bacterium]
MTIENIPVGHFDAGVPRYLLYGEPLRRAAADFLHIEPLSTRSAAHGWEIGPHRHEGLAQVFWVREGGGEARIDGMRAPVEGAALIVVPAATVHAFSWRAGSEGVVLTLAAGYATGLAGAMAPPVAHSLDAARMLHPPADAAADIDRLLGQIAEECRRAPLGMAVAVAALVQLLMVAIARLAPAQSAILPGGAALWQRFRDLVEEKFRTHHGVPDIAAPLAITRGRLDAVCRRHVGRTAQQVVHDRLILEAQRGLLYTGRTIAEIAYGLGFADPAYFTRFFTRETGEPPGDYRRRHREAA